jgi:hypothetical protein
VHRSENAAEFVCPAATEVPQQRYMQGCSQGAYAFKTGSKTCSKNSDCGRNKRFRNGRRSLVAAPGREGLDQVSSSWSKKPARSCNPSRLRMVIVPADTVPNPTLAR